MNVVLASMTSRLLLVLVIICQCFCTLLVPQVVGQDSLSLDECPEPNGFYADAVQCDRYYECKNSTISDKLCPDGLVFDELSTFHTATCSFPFSVDCTGRTELQKAHPTPLCPRKNGYFPHEDRAICDQFYFCADGLANKLNCPEGLIFNTENGQCAFSDQIKREGCSSLEFSQFKCPNDPNSPHEHPTYPDPTDCQYYFLCLGGKDARRNGCQAGLVFNPKTSLCDQQENLDSNDNCRSYYNETFLENIRGASGGTRNQAGGTGIKLDTKNRKRVPIVRRKKPRPQVDTQSSIGAKQPTQRRPEAQASGIAGSVTGASGRRRVPAEPRLRAQQASLNRQIVEKLKG